MSPLSGRIADNLGRFLRSGQITSLQQAVAGLEKLDLSKLFTHLKPIFIKTLESICECYESGELKPTGTGILGRIKRRLTKGSDGQLLLKKFHEAFTKFAKLEKWTNSVKLMQITKVVGRFIKAEVNQDKIKKWLSLILSWMTTHVLIYYSEKGIPDSTLEIIQCHIKEIPRLENPLRLINLYNQEEKRHLLREELTEEAKFQEDVLIVRDKMLFDRLHNALWFAKNTPYSISVGIADYYGLKEKQVKSHLISLFKRVIKELGDEMGFFVTLISEEESLFQFPRLPSSKTKGQFPVEELASIDPDIAELKFLWFVFIQPAITFEPQRTAMFEHHAVPVNQKLTNFILIRLHPILKQNLSDQELYSLLKRTTAESFGRPFPHSDCILGDESASQICALCAFRFLKADPAKRFHGLRQIRTS